MRSPDARLAWILAHPPGQPGRCAETVMRALDLPKQGLGDATAVYRRTVALGHGMQHGPAPKGAIHYWTGGSAGHGHVGIATGDGQVASVDVNDTKTRHGTTGTKPLAWFAAHWGNLRYQGWSWWWGRYNTQPEEVAMAGWTVGQDKVIEAEDVTVTAGKYSRVGRIVIPKPGSYLLTLQTRLPAGRYARIRFVRDGWGADPDGRDETGPDPLTPPDGAATSFTRHHRIKGGGPVDYEIKVSGSGTVTLPYVICKAERIT